MLIQLGATPAEKPQTIPLRIITYNVRYATSQPVAHERLWRERCPLLCAQLNFITTGHPSAFICLQEPLAGQIDDIQAHLGDGWSHIGSGRDDGRREGEFCPVFYQNATWRCEGAQTYWLSETPDKPSRGWDAALPRVVTVGSFTHRAHGGRVVVMCTHFDHVGEVARQKSAELILNLARRAGKGGASPAADAVLLAGDFNSEPDDMAYRTMVAEGSGMVDLRDAVPPAARYGNDLTYTTFGEPEWWPSRIDFLFLGVPSEAKARTFGVLANRFDDGIYLSDHRPVVADLEVTLKARGS